jgi:uncharacterized protein YecA (UPF0149 family)
MEQRVDEQALETIFKFDFPRPRLESTAQAAAPNSSASAAGRGLPGTQPARAAAAAGGRVAKVGRNEPCPCGSGKKYKRCHGG